MFSRYSVRIILRPTVCVEELVCKGPQTGVAYKPKGRQSGRVSSDRDHARVTI